MAKTMHANSIMVLHPYRTHNFVGPDFTSGGYDYLNVLTGGAPGKGNTKSRHYSGWAFDDQATGLVREAFVAGADVLMSAIADELAEECKVKRLEKMTIQFAASPFPGHRVKLEKVGAAMGSGTDYVEPTRRIKLWLCPALFLYFPVAPENIYLAASPFLGD